MHVSLQGVVVASVASLAAAGTLRQPASPRNFRIPQTANPKFQGHSLGRSLAKLHRKYGVSVSEATPPGVKVHLAEPGDSSPSFSSSTSTTSLPSPHSSGKDWNSTKHNVSATAVDQGSEWITPVTIGTPPQLLNFVFDSGSSDLWVMSDEMKGPVAGHNIYDPDKSTSSRPLVNATWSIAYGDGSSSSGDVFLDVVQVGDLVFSLQAVEVVQVTSSIFLRSSADGLLGLAYPQLNGVKPLKQAGFFQNIAPQLDSPVFVADLRRNGPGAYYFGAIPDEVASPVYYGDVDLTNGGWWRTDIQDADGVSMTAISDTGTTLIILPGDRVDNYYAKISSAFFSPFDGGWLFSCNDTLPDWSFSVGGGNITVPGHLLMYAPVDGGLCAGGIQQLLGAPFAIMGDIALQAAFGVFDMGNNRVGWAQKSPEQMARPAEPGRPSQTGSPQPTQPTARPTRTGQPSQPEHTGQPEHAGQPEHTGQPEHAGQPEHIGQPEHTGQPGQPRHTRRPGQPQHTNFPPPQHTRQTSLPPQPQQTHQPPQAQHMGQPAGQAAFPPKPA